MIRVPYIKHSPVTDDDVQAVERALRSEKLTQGWRVEEFEAKCADFFGKDYAVAFCNGTAALYAAYRAHPERTFVIPAITFKATMMAAQVAGKDVTITDCYETSGLPHTVVKVKVDLAGYVPGEHTPIEDASHAFGSFGVGEADITCFSLHAIKHLGVGEGGLAVTDDRELAWRLGAYREYGFGLNEPSLNLRMPEMTAALGISRLERVFEEKAKKVDLFERYLSELSDHVVFAHPELASGDYNPHLCIIHVQNVRDFRDLLEVKGIGTQRHYKPLISAQGSAAYWRTAVSIPLYPQLTKKEQDQVIKAVKEAL